MELRGLDWAKGTPTPVYHRADQRDKQPHTITYRKFQSPIKLSTWWEEAGAPIGNPPRQETPAHMIRGMTGRENEGETR